jgi:hypothetical protein
MKHMQIMPATRIHKKPITSKTMNSETIVNSQVIPVSVNLRLEYIQSKYEEVHDTFSPFQPSRDIFVLFNSGLSNEWKPALNEVMKTRCLTVFTSFNKNEQDADVEWVKKELDGYDVVLRPTFNRFSSMKPDIPIDCVHDSEHWMYSNWGLFAVRGIGNVVGETRDDLYLQPRESKGVFGWFDDSQSS